MFTYISVSSDFVSRFNHRRNYVQEIHACLFSQHECSPRSNLHHFLRTSVQYFSAIFAARIILWQRDAGKEEINNKPNDAFRRTIANLFLKLWQAATIARDFFRRQLWRDEFEKTYKEEDGTIARKKRTIVTCCNFLCNAKHCQL